MRHDVERTHCFSQRRESTRKVVTKGTRRTGLKCSVPLAHSGTAQEVQMMASTASVKAMILPKVFCLRLVGGRNAR